MADSGRKRCRKSKLVLRDCADFVEDEVVLQDVKDKEPPQKKRLLEKIKKEPVDFVEQSAHRFSVNVDIEVEDMEGSAPEEDNYMNYLFSISTEAQAAERNKEFIDNKSLIEKRPVPQNLKSCSVDIRKLQQMLAQLHWKYPHEKEAVIHTRNQWGRIFVNKATEFERNTHETQLQCVLSEWITWTVSSNSRIRESPFSYKCYICETAWWSYSEFSEHITRHTNVKLKLEILQQECNIIAFETFGTFKEIPVHGKCLKCARYYDQHMLNRISTDLYYYCSFCSDRFQTCSSLAKHESLCARNPIDAPVLYKDGKGVKISDYTCKICGTLFMSNPDLHEHLTICHEVRSDVPILTKLKTCRLCNLCYFNFNFHECSKKHGNYECQYCNSKFHNKHLLKQHQKVWNKIVRCRICEKLISWACMAGEHYALHSENFEVVHRCLVCKKVKVFMTEDDMKMHRSKYHTNVDPKWLRSEKITMSKLMLRHCFVDIVKKVKKNGIVPKAVPSKAQKLTRGETMQLVRVYAPIKRKSTDVPLRRKNENRDIESQANTTVAHDNTVSMRGQPLKDVVILVKKEIVREDTISKNDKTGEKDDDKVKDTISENNDETGEKDNVPEDLGAVVIKTEKIDTVENNENPGPSADKLQAVKDNTKIVEELNEFLDIKPDIIKIKEEKISDDESENTLDTSEATQIDDISKVFRPSSTFTDETDSDNSKVFRLSQVLLESNIKEEIKEEPAGSSANSAPNIVNSDLTRKPPRILNSDLPNLEPLNLEPEIILKAGYKKRKVYSCKRCDYAGYHREYKQHLNSFCRISKNRLDTGHSLYYACSKCNVEFPNMKRYALHFEKYHLYHNLTCPQCTESFDSVSKFVPHLSKHVRYQFVRLQMFDFEETNNSKQYQCKTCEEVVQGRDFFEHWESHLELAKEPHSVPERAEPYKKGAGGDHALKEDVLKQILAALLRDDRLGPEARNAKTCIVCRRSFDRRHDVKRHLVEHLLEDAHANIVDNMALQCQICRKLFRTPHFYKKHMRDHASLPIYQCTICDKTFSDSSNFTKHKKIHNLKAYICDVCGKKFQAKFSLEKHIEKHMRDHASLPIYQCTICDKTFSDSSNFTKHKKIHNLKAYICDVCGKKFQAKFSLEKHIEMHMNSDPITCERCDKVFYCNSFYRRHYRQNHDKPINRYKCTLCRESFSSLKDKWDHLWIVHKQRKDKADCPICGKSYRKFSDVKKHVQTEHNMEVRLILARPKKGEKVKQEVKEEMEVKEEVDSDDDCLLIEEERETLVVYD